MPKSVLASGTPPKPFTKSRKHFKVSCNTEVLRRPRTFIHSSSRNIASCKEFPSTGHCARSKFSSSSRRRKSSSTSSPSMSGGAASSSRSSHLVQRSHERETLRSATTAAQTTSSMALLKAFQPSCLEMGEELTRCELRVVTQHQQFCEPAHALADAQRIMKATIRKATLASLVPIKYGRTPATSTLITGADKPAKTLSSAEHLHIDVRSTASSALRSARGARLPCHPPP